MIAEIQREQFLANPQGFARTSCLAVAIVSGEGEEEPEVLGAWTLLKERLNGAGTRIGHRAFVVLLEDSENDLRTEIAKFSVEKPAHAFWRFVAASIRDPKDSSMIIREVEWRAHKAVQSQEMPVLCVIGVGGSLQ